MKPKVPYSLKGTVGKSKGKFIKRKVKDKIETFLKSTSGKQGRRVNVEKSETVVLRSRNKMQQALYEKIEGRRVVEMECLQRDLWCYKCKKPLSLRFASNEKQIGIVSKYTITCPDCRNNVTFSTSTANSKKKYSSNMKLATSMLDAGMGERKLNTLLSGLNIPSVSASTLKRFERQVGEAIQELADESCLAAIEKEKKLTLEALRTE